MGIDIDSKLIIGWLVDVEKLREWREELKLEECCSRNSYMCECDLSRIELPDKFTLTFTSPYFDCDYKYKRIFLSYICEDTLTFEDTAIIFKDKEAFDSVKDLLNKLGGDGGEPHIISVVNVW